MLFHQWLGGRQKKDPSPIHSSEQHHESNDSLSQTRWNHNHAGCLERCGCQIHLEKALFHGLWQEMGVLQIGGHDLIIFSLVLFDLIVLLRE
jgi:hypothetical protein